MLSVFRLEGELDESRAPLLAVDLALWVASDPAVDRLIDCSGVAFIDGAGLYVIDCLRREVEAGGHQLFVHAMPTLAQRLVDALGWPWPGPVAALASGLELRLSSDLARSRSRFLRSKSDTLVRRADRLLYRSWELMVLMEARRCVGF